MKRHITFTPLVKSVHGVFSPHLNTYIKFIQLLAAGLSERFAVTYGNMATNTKIRIQMRVLRAASMCIRGIKKV